MEVNSNFYSDGLNDGRKQVYLTPGISAGRFSIYKHLQLSTGAGFEIAVTHFHPSPTSLSSQCACHFENRLRLV
jgi:hypothetical protein